MSEVTREEHESLKGQVSNLGIHIEKLADKTFARIEQSEESTRTDIRNWREEFSREQSKISDNLSQSGKFKLAPTISIVSLVWAIASACIVFAMNTSKTQAVADTKVELIQKANAQFLSREFDPLNEDVAEIIATRYKSVDGLRVEAHVEKLEDEFHKFKYEHTHTQ